MGGLWILCAVIYSSISFSHQEITSVRTSKISPVEVAEEEEVKLQCTIKASEPPVLVQWLLDDEVVTNGSYVYRDSYNVALSLKRPTVYSYHLSITPVNRTDQGRWTCRAFGDSTQFEKSNIILIVFYTPDSMYPICGLQGTSVVCRTQEGNPRVSLNWYAQRVTDRLNLKPSSTSTVHGVIMSEVSMAFLRPPNWTRESVVCDTGIGNCSVSKLSIYNSASVNISTEFVNNEVIVHCNSSNALEDGMLVIERNDTSIEGRMTQEADYATLRFSDQGYGYRKEIIYCRYLWGILDELHDMMEINVPYPRPISTTFETTTAIVTEFDNVELLSTKMDDLTTQQPSRSTLFTSPSDDETSRQTTNPTMSESMHFSRMEDGDGDSRSMGLTTLPDNDEELATLVPDVTTERDDSTSSIGEELTTLIPDVTTERDDSTSSLGEELTTLVPDVTTERDYSTSSIGEDLTTITEVTEKDDSIFSIADTTPITSTSIKPIDYIETTKATNLISEEIRTTKQRLVTNEPATRFKRPTIPLLPPKEKQSPAKPENITLIVLFVVAIIVISLVAVIIYQKWKEKTGSYSLPTTTSSNSKGSSSIYKHKC